MSKVKLDLRKVVAIAICLAGFFANNVLAQVGIAKTAQPIKIGESYKIKIAPPTKTKVKISDSGVNLEVLGIDRYIDSPVFSDFKIETSEDGSLTLFLESFAEHTWFAIFNGDGRSFEPTKQEIISGDNGSRSFDSGMKSGFDDRDKFVSCVWNQTVETFSGSYTFKLDAGIYYIRIFRGEIGLSTANLSFKLIDLDGNEVKQ